MSNTIAGVFLLVITFYIYRTVAYDYCEIESRDCKNRQHIRCHPDQMMKKIRPPFEKTTNYSRVPMTNFMRQVILDAHNELRNEISCGRQKNKKGETFPPAGAMRELIWDDELEYIAGGHADQCVMAHDECRSSARFKLAGQNLASLITTGGYKGISIIDKIQKLTKAWYNEYKDTPIKNVNVGLGAKQKGPQIGHFTVLCSDAVTRLGCAISRCWFKQNNKLLILYTCDYSYTNMIGRKMYHKADQPASKCADVESIKSLKYECLCENSNVDYKL